MAQQRSFTATATGPIAGAWDAGAGLTRGTHNMRVTSAAPDAVVAMETSPDNTVWTEITRTSAGKMWGFGGSSQRARYVRANVISLGTGAPGVAAVIVTNP
jgi:hypothetical protein